MKSDPSAGLPRSVGGALAPPVLRRVGAVALFTALTAVAARIAVPLPGTVVPFTLQVAAVLLSGLLIGPRLGAASQALYLGLGLVGLPVFAVGGGAAYLLGPTGGYLLTFPAAAALAGWGATRGGAISTILGGLAGVALIHLGGWAWLTVIAGASVAFRTGVLPFLAGDLLKLALAVVVGLRFGGRTRAFLR